MSGALRKPRSNARCSLRIGQQQDSCLVLRGPNMSLHESPFKRYASCVYNFCMKKALLLALLVLCASAHQFPYSSRARPNRSAKQSFCGTYPGRIRDDLRRFQDLRAVIQARKPQLALSAVSGATQDLNNIAVIEDDGNIVTDANPLDLAGKDLKLTPNSANSYTLTLQDGTVSQDFGTKLPLTDDDFREVAFQPGFRFPFFGTSYSSVFINSDGNVTFTEGDAEHTARDLGRFNSGAPRIAPLFADLDPTTGQGGVYYNQFADRFMITWKLIREFEGFLPNTAQLSLFPDGSFELTYGALNTSEAIAGWSGGRNLHSVNLVDLTTLGAAPLSGANAEKFSQSVQVEFTALAKKFYSTHPDNYDQLVFFTDFPFALVPTGDAFAYEATVQNDIRGINTDTYDFSQEFGSQGRLQSYLVMNQLAAYPDNPDVVALRTYTSLQVLGHETAHRWLAYVRFKDGGTNSENLLGIQQAHWSFLFNADASVMEGNLIQDNEDGSFTITDATKHYSKLDQYLMGLRPAADVEPLFYVQPEAGVSYQPDDITTPSAIGATFRGTRKDVSIQSIIAAEGSRLPDVSVAPKTFHQAYVLLVRRGTSPAATSLDKLRRIREGFPEFYDQASDHKGVIATTLDTAPLTPLISGVVPSSGSTLGNTRVYISGSDFQSGVIIAFGASDASDVRLVSPSLIIATTPPGVAGAVNVVVTNPGSQSTTRSNAFTYRTLAQVTVSANALRIPYAVDNLYFRSNLGINNPGAATANVRILQLDANGLVVNELADVSIPPNGFLQENSLLRTLEGSSGTTGREGSLVLESEQPVQGFVSQIENSSGDPSILDGIRQGAAHLILQSAANTGPFRSTLLVLNLSASQALVSIAGLSRDTGQPVGIPLHDLAIPANGFISFENILADLSLPDSYGPVDIRSTNGALLSAISRVSGFSGNTSGFFVAQAANAGTQSEIIPFAIDTESFRTNLGLNNFGTSIASVNVSFVSPDGSTRASTPSPIPVAPGGLVQINNILRYLLTGSSSSAVSNQQGYLKVTSDQPIKAFATQIDNLSFDPSIENSISTSSGVLFLKSSANTNFQSTLVIINPNSSAATVTLVSRQGSTTGNGAVTGTRTINVPTRGLYFSPNVLKEIGATSAYGPIEIRSSLNQPIIAVSRVYSVTGNTSGFFSAQPLP